MPLIHKKNIHSQAVLGIWETTESEEELLHLYPCTDEELMMLHSFTHPFRRKQFLASRLLLHTLAPGEKIVYNENGKPFLKSGDTQEKRNNNVHISLSHSASFIAILIDNKMCGVDIEIIRPKIEKIVPKFLCEKEIEEASGDFLTERLHIYWCVKEAHYKVNGKKNVSLRRNIFVHKILNTISGITTSTIDFEGTVSSRQVNYERFRDCMLAWTT